MAQQRTKELIKNALEISFNLNNFKLFINNLLNKADFSKNQIISPEEVGSEFKEHIKSCQLLGEYTDKNGKKIHILVVQFNNEGSVGRARTLQRNFIAKYLKSNSGVDSSLVAFFQEKSPDWRFSFVKLDLSLNEKGNLNYEFTPARRYSFLVGKDEFSHTAQSQLAPIIENEGDIYISDIEECFHIEKVTKEFFEKYRGLFDRLLKSIDSLIKKDMKIKKEFEDKNIEKEDFAKRILGQIVFLYFLQKKGWFGIEKDQLSKKFKKFGDGDKNFLYNLFKKCKGKNKNFFNDYLEHLFYSALAQDRRADDDQFHLQGIDYKLPFLNGGLFEPIGANKGYNWRETDILVSNELFSNSDGEGILDTFNLYNFTVKEDEPMEKEVAIDPEMLGKVFENLLDTKERKSTGSFYTPREIVHYMCQQSLINYLGTNTKLKKEIIEKFVNENNSQDIPEEIIENKFRIDNLLKEIKVVDPAVGSGAFLVGMMSEIVRARSLLNSGKKIFDLKEECIENNLYGVDISPGAVDICQLRLWLSLIVDEEDYGNVKPLPNLDYKIMCGNSLIENYKGMKLWDDKWLGIKKPITNNNEQIKKIDIRLNQLKSKIPYLINQKEKRKELEKEIRKLEKEKIELRSVRGENLPLFESDSARKLIILKKYHEEFTHISDRMKKQEQKKKIEDATIELIKSKLIEENKKDSLKEVEEILQKKRSMPFFLWKMNFIDVFQRENPGFDVVIANPPYIFSRENLTKEEKDIYRKNYSLTQFKLNLYILFIEKSFNLMNQKGCLAFITPNNWLTLSTTSDLRHFILTKTYDINLILNFEKVFESASVDTCILNLKKLGESTIKIHEWTENGIKLVNTQNRDFYLKSTNYTISNVNSFSDVNSDLCEKIHLNSEPLSNFAEVRNGVQAYTVGEGIPIQTEDMKEHRVYHSNGKKDKTWIKYFDGVDVGRYVTGWGGQFIKYGKNLSRRRKPELFERERILVRQIPSPPPHCINGCYVTENAINDNNSMIIKVYDNQVILKYILSLINSKLVSFWFVYTFGKLQRKIFPQFKVNELRIFPIKKISPENQKPFIEIVDKILSITNSKDYLENQDKQSIVKELEKRIDQRVYKLYELTLKEIEIVENFNKK